MFRKIEEKIFDSSRVQSPLVGIIRQVKKKTPYYLFLHRVVKMVKLIFDFFCTKIKRIFILFNMLVSIVSPSIFDCPIPSSTPISSTSFSNAIDPYNISDDIDSSDIEQIDYSSDGENEDDFIENDMNDLLKSDVIPDDRPLHDYTDLTVREFSNDFLELCCESKVSESQRCKILSLITKYMPTISYVPSRTEEIMNAAGFEKFYVTERLCSTCYSNIVNGKCHNQACNTQGIRLSSSETIDIVSFDLEKELELFCFNILELMRNYQQKARTRSVENQTDIVCGDVYQCLLQNQSSFFISIMLHSDGLPIYRSRTCSVWPILGAIIELPPMARSKCRNILLISLWIGRSKPNLSLVLEKLSPQLNHLKNVGLKIDSKQRALVLFPIILGDMPALADMVNFVQPTAYHACMFCTTKGQYSHQGRCVIYPNDNVSVIRLPDEFSRCARVAAINCRNRSIETIGLRGISEFSKVLDAPMPLSIAIDGMHTSFLCHGKKLLIHVSLNELISLFPLKIS